MKGLLIKDAYTLLRQTRIFLLLIVVFAVMPGESMSGFALVYAAMLPITAMAYDEHARWDVLAAMMPYRVRDLVLSKYLLGYIGLAAAGGLAVAAKVIIAAVKGQTVSVEQWVALLAIACAAMIVLAVNLTFIFRFGVEKGRIAFFIVVAVTVLISLLLRDKLIEIIASVPSVPLFGLEVFAVAVVLNVAAALLSVVFYKKRRCV